MTPTGEKFFNALEKIIEENGIEIDRPKGSRHPNFPDFIYEVDYGYIRSSKSQDGKEIDVFVGTSDAGAVGCVCTIDLLKKDSEIKVLFNCTREEIDLVLEMMSHDPMSCVFIARGI